MRAGHIREGRQVTGIGRYGQVSISSLSEAWDRAVTEAFDNIREMRRAAASHDDVEE